MEARREAIAKDIFISNDCVVREVNCIQYGVQGAVLAATHATNTIDWSQPNDLDCWHCCHPFDTPPVPLPHEYDARHNTLSVYGNFCSFACAKAYQNEYHTFDAGRKLLLLHQMARAHYGQDLGSVVAAPPRIALARFGGCMSIEEFRKAATQVRVHAPPFVPHTHVIEKAQDESTNVRGWSVYDVWRDARCDEPTPAPAGERGLYFDFLKQHEASEHAARPAAEAASSGSLSRFLRRSE